MFPLLLALAQTSPLDLTLMPSGLFDRIKGYAPMALDLSDTRPQTVTRVPDSAKPRFGTIRFGKNEFVAMLDEADKLYVDANRDGDLTNDPPASWARKKFANGNEGWEGRATVNLSFGGRTEPCVIGLYGTDRPNQLGYYADFALTGKVALGGKRYETFYSDLSAAWSGSAGTLMIDKDGDGKFHPGYEFYRANEPFNVAGTTYELGSKDGRLVLAKSRKSVEERTVANSAPADPNLANGLRVGKPALTFTAATMQGRNVSFPKTYAGKIVLIDFWATWCGPCMREVPGLVQAYEKYRGRGFEVLGVSLDRAGAAEQVKSVTAKHGMTWDQIYDGNFFDAATAKRYGIKAIPATYLVDGDSGLILAMGNDLRGERLAATIEKALTAKKR